MKPTTTAIAGGYTITDKTVVSGANSIGELINHYVMVDTEKSSSGLWPEAVRIRPLKASVGKVTSMEQSGAASQYKFVISGKEYLLSHDKLLTNVKEDFLNHTVLCIFDGEELIRLDALHFIAGTVKVSGGSSKVTLETEITSDVRKIEDFHAVCEDTVSSIPAVGSAVGCYYVGDVLVEIEERNYQTKVGTLGMYDSESNMAVIDGVPIHINLEEWEWSKNTERKSNVEDYVGARVFYLLANDEIVHMDTLEKIKYELTATYPGIGLSSNRATYQNGSFNNYETTVRGKAQVATISYMLSYYPFLKPYNSEIVYAAIEKPAAITLESTYWEEENGFECKGPEVGKTTLNPGSKAERGFMVTIQSDFVPPYASKTIVNTLHIAGTSADGKPISCKMGYQVEVVNKDYNSSKPDDEPDEVIDETELTAYEKGLLENLYKIEDVDVTVDNGTYALSQYFDKSTISDIGRTIVFWRAAMDSKLAKETKGTMPEDLVIECTMTQGRYKGHKATLLFHVKSYLDWSDWGAAMLKDISFTLIDNKTNATLVEKGLYSVHVQGSPKKFADGIQAYLKVEYIKDVTKFCKKLGKKVIKNAITDFAKITGKEYLNSMLDLYKNIDVIASTAKKSYKYVGKASKILRNPINVAVADANEINKIVTKLAKVECPVDVYIYNPKGELCGSIENNSIVVDTAEVFMGVDGDTKSMWLNDDYTVKLIATGEGSMNYSIHEYSGTDENRSVFFDNLPLATGVTYEGNISEGLGVSVTDYALKSNTGKTIQADRDTSGSVSAIYTVTFSANGGSVTPSTKTTNETGKLTTSLPAPTRTGYIFDGWYTEASGGTRITADTVFTENATVYAHWVYTGGNGGSTTDRDSSSVRSRSSGYNSKSKPTEEQSTITTKTDWVNPFIDIYENAWYYPAVRYVNENSLMSGAENSYTFAPNEVLSRSMLAQILYNKEGKPAVTKGSGFADVSSGAWYEDAVTWASEKGIVSGYEDGRFASKDPVTREQFAVMLWRYSGCPAASTENLAFNDIASVRSYALEAMAWAVSNNIISGYEGNWLAPGEYASRVQVAQMLKNYLDK